MTFLRVAACLYVSACVLGASAQAHWAPEIRSHNTAHAIRLVWCGSSNRWCPVGWQAWHVAGCETGGTYSQWARNGQYLGIFQMGRDERKLYGHAWNPWGQARAAHRYWRLAGWSPWDFGCAP